MAMLVSLSSLQATTISTGGLAIVGYQDNATTDYFTVLATEDIAAGTTVYFTNNGWSNTSSQFSGVSSSSYDAAGGQELTKVTVNSTISAGTVFSSADTSNGSFTWTTSGTIPGASNSHFSALNLLHDPMSADQASDQIYILQAGSTRPLDNVSNFIFALDLGDPNANPAGFTAPVGYSSGAAPDGNVRVNGSIVFTDSALSTQANGDANDNTAVALNPDSNFHDGTFGLKLSGSTFSAMNATGATKADWLAYLADSNNWSAQSSLTTGTGIVNINIQMVPEPSRTLFLMLGMVAVIRRRARSLT
jgi:hypothetical protein